MLSVVVRITDFDESPKPVVDSVLNNKERVKELLFVHPNYNGTPIYTGWTDDAERLKNANIGVRFCASFSAESVAGNIVVDVPPQCELKLGAFDAIQRQMERANNNQTHFALAPVLQLSNFSIFYGFIVIMQTIDWLWNRIYERNKLIQYADVQARFLLKRGDRQFLPKPAFIWRIWNSATIPKLHTRSAVVHLENDSGWMALMWLLGTHTHLGLGFWILPYFAFYIVLSFSWTMMVAYRTMLLYAGAMWIAEACVAYLACRNYVRTGNLFFYCVLFPAYWILFPFVLIHARWR